MKRTKIEDGVLVYDDKELYKNGTFIIPDTVKKIEKYTFENHSFSNIIIPESVKIIRQYAFNYCKSLKEIVIPNSVNYLGDCAFMGCDSLQSVIISDNINYIRMGTFAHCKKLNKVILPPNVQSIGQNAFYNTAPGFTLVYEERLASLANNLKKEYGDKINLEIVPYVCEIF